MFGLQQEEVLRWLKAYESLGPMPGILAPVAEAFLPFLPLIVILLGNAKAYGLWEGFFLSWFGVVTGSILVFLISRKWGVRSAKFLRGKFATADRTLGWLEGRGFVPIFILACFPFAPSFLVNVASGLSNIRSRTFIQATIAGKAIMVMSVSLVGDNLFRILQSPWQTGAVVAAFLLAWWIGKRIELRLRSQ